MKKFFFTFLVLAVSTSFPIFLSLAADTPAPVVDDPLSPVNANLIVITGTADPGAKVYATGGPYNISPVTTNSQGKFAITVALAQETTNIFLIQARNDGSELSEAVQIEIVEGDEVTAQYEADNNVDRTAPEPPEIADTSIVTEEATYTLTGTGEEDAEVIVNGEGSGEKVDNDGAFSVELELTGESTKDSFDIQLEDKSGNQSTAVKVSITSSAAVSEDTGETLPPLPDIVGHWAEVQINTLYQRGVVSGYENGTFGPNDNVTRAQIMKIALNAFEATVDESNANPSSFNDVASSDWFKSYVDTGAAIGIVNGYEDGSFRPNNPVTRGEALKIVLEAGGFTDLSSTGSNFSDVDSVADWFAKYTAFAKQNGIVGGYSDGTFRGNQSITRAEVCVIVQKLVDYLAGQE